MSWSPRADAKLLAQYRDGDYNAFLALYGRYYSLVFSIALGVLSSREDAEDASQEVMLTLAKKLISEEPRNLKAWIAQVTRNASIDYLRARKQTFELPEGFESRLPVEDVSSVIGRRDELQNMLDSLKQLSEKQRTALVMKEIAGASCNEIATTLGTTTGRVKDLLRTGRLALRAHRAAENMTCVTVQEAIASESDWRRAPRQVRVHVKECKDCAAFKEQMRHDRYLLRGLLPVAGMPMLWQLSYRYSGARSRFGETLGGFLMNDHISAIATAGAVVVVGSVAVVGVNGGGTPGQDNDPVVSKDGTSAVLAAQTSSSGGAATTGFAALASEQAKAEGSPFSQPVLSSAKSGVAAPEVSPSSAVASATASGVEASIGGEKAPEATVSGSSSSSSGAISESGSSYSSSAPAGTRVVSRGTPQSSSPSAQPKAPAQHSQQLSSGASSGAPVQEVSAPSSSVSPTSESGSGSSGSSSSPSDSGSSVSPTRPPKVRTTPRPRVRPRPPRN